MRDIIKLEQLPSQTTPSKWLQPTVPPEIKTTKQVTYTEERTISNNSKPVETTDICDRCYTRVPVGNLEQIGYGVYCNSCISTVGESGCYTADTL